MSGLFVFRAGSQPSAFSAQRLAIRTRGCYLKKQTTKDTKIPRRARSGVTLLRIAGPIVHGTFPNCGSLLERHVWRVHGDAARRHLRRRLWLAGLLSLGLLA